MQTIQCPKCRQQWAVPEYCLGQEVKCTCGCGFIARSKTECTNTTSSLPVSKKIRQKISQLVKEGSDIVEVIPNGDNCPKCSPYECRLFSLTGKTIGLPTLESAIRGGLFHRGCKHTICSVPLSVAFHDHDRNGYPLSGYNSRPGKIEFQSAENFKKKIKFQSKKKYNIPAEQPDDYEQAKRNVFAMIIVAIFVLGIVFFIVGTFL